MVMDMSPDHGATAERTWVTPNPRQPLTPPPNPPRHITGSPYGDAAVDAALTDYYGLTATHPHAAWTAPDRARMRAALDAADTHRAADTQPLRHARPRSVEVFAAYGIGTPRRVGDWTDDPAQLAEHVQLAQAIIASDPAFDDWRVVDHGPGSREWDEHTAKVLADITAAAVAATEEEYRAECDGFLTFADADAHADHVLECGICQAEERDHLDAEDAR